LIRQRSRNNQLLLEAALQIRPDIDRAIQTYGRDRIGIVLGTSTSGIDEASEAWAITCAISSSRPTTTTSNRNSAHRPTSSPTGCR
jgi:hypothetical protein